MFEYIAGRLVSRRPDRAVIDAGGVGYRILIPLSTYERLPARGDAPVRLLVIHHQREDRQALFGFATEEERDYFEVLTGVSGVGPSLALGILSSMAFDAFRAAVVHGDGAALTRVRGVGKKLAGRILVDLAEEMKARGPVASRGAPAATEAVDAALALVALGFEKREAESRAAEAARDLGEGTAPGEIVREVLRRHRR